MRPTRTLLLGALATATLVACGTAGTAPVALPGVSLPTTLPTLPISTTTSTVSATSTSTSTSSTAATTSTSTAAPSSTLWVAPNGDDANPGTKARPLATVATAMDRAKPGMTIEVASGTYGEALTTHVDGRAGAPITLRGHDAVLDGDADHSGRVLQIFNDHWTVEGFELTGQDTAIWVQGATGIAITSNEIHDLRGECVRVKYLSSDITIDRNYVHDCGLEDFVQSPGSGKNGEGVYIGTAPEQLSRNPTPEPDATTRVFVRDNVFETHGNECVDIKEGATGNVVEFNDCSEQRDPDSAGLDARGSGNVFRYNRSHDNVGAGVRVGGDTTSDGINNDIIGNELLDNEGSGIKVMRLPQGTVCGNRIERSGSGAINTDEVKNTDCDETVPTAGPRYETPKDTGA